MRVSVLLVEFNHWFDIHLPSRVNVGDCIWLDEVLPKEDVTKLMKIDSERYMDKITDAPIYEVVSVDWRKDGDGIYQCLFIEQRK
jgi:hypothetical protein